MFNQCTFNKSVIANQSVIQSMSINVQSITIKIQSKRQIGTERVEFKFLAKELVNDLTLIYLLILCK